MAPAARPPSRTSSPRTSDHTVEGIAEHAAPASPAARASPGTPPERRRLTRASWQALNHSERSVLPDQEWLGRLAQLTGVPPLKALPLRVTPRERLLTARARC